jgi:hypothetical protein
MQRFAAMKVVWDAKDAKGTSSNEPAGPTGTSQHADTADGWREDHGCWRCLDHETVAAVPRAAAARVWAGLRDRWGGGTPKRR